MCVRLQAVGRAKERVAAMDLWAWKGNDVPRSVLLWRADATEQLFRKFVAEEVKKVAAEVKAGAIKLTVRPRVCNLTSVGRTSRLAAMNRPRRASASPPLAPRVRT